MSAISALQLAVAAIEDARKRLNRAKEEADDDYEIRQAIRFLDDATEYIKKATVELKQ